MPHAPAHGLDQFADDRQTDAAALPRFQRFAAALDERPEDAFDIFRRHPRPLIGARECQVVVVQRGAQANDLARRAEIDGVREQVVEHDLQFLPVGASDNTVSRRA